MGNYKPGRAEHAVCGWTWADDRTRNESASVHHTCSDGARHAMEHRCNCGALYPS